MSQHYQLLVYVQAEVGFRPGWECVHENNINQLVDNINMMYYSCHYLSVQKGVPRGTPFSRLAGGNRTHFTKFNGMVTMRPF